MERERQAAEDKRRDLERIQRERDYERQMAEKERENRMREQEYEREKLAARAAAASAGPRGETEFLRDLRARNARYTVKPWFLLFYINHTVVSLFRTMHRTLSMWSCVEKKKFKSTKFCCFGPS